MLIRSTYILILSLLAVSAKAQAPMYSNAWQKTLTNRVIGKESIYGKWTKEGNDELHLTYLGTVVTNKGKKYKIMYSKWIWGLSHHATSRILIFSNSNRYIGQYNLDMTYQLPKKLFRNELVFKCDDDDCDKSIVTNINLRTGLPKRFFLPCENETSGDLIYFESD